MQYKNIFLTTLILSTLSPLLVLAINPSNSTRVLENFKEVEHKILFETIPFSRSGSTELLQNEYRMNGLEWLKRKLASIQETYTIKKNLATEKRNSLEGAMKLIDDAVITTEQDIGNSENSIMLKRGRIQEYQITSLQLKRKIFKNRSIIFSYLASIHTESSLIYSAHNEIDMFQGLILSSETTDAIVSDITYKSLVSELGQKFVDEYKTLIRDYYRITIQTKQEVSELEDLSTVLDRQKSNLLIQKWERQKIIDITKWQESLFQKYIDSQHEAEVSIDTAWQDATKAYNASLDVVLEKNGCNVVKKSALDVQKCSMMLSYYRNERALKNISLATGTTNIMQWPVNSSRITTYFRDPDYYVALGSQHDAIDIGIDQGSEVTAALDGYVYYILPPAQWGYSYIALRHPDGYITVYGHLSEVDVLPYQFVTKWQVIAKSGWNPGTPGAWPMTSGAHLHFEVWHNDEVIDPLRVLTTAPIDYGDLPSRYQEKFLDDMVESYGTGKDLSQYELKFTLKGKTEEDRQKYLLTTYAVPEFQNWDLWADAALENHIDPSFFMCVGLAETTLGNNLKTQYNIGNIGNTDDGSTYAFENATEGLDWMAKTFNNKYLFQYNHVSDLSRWGNDTGPIYASSNANWHNNVIRCLSAIKGRFVEDDYNFRVTQSSI